MSSAIRRHKRDVALRSLVALPILILLGYQFLEAKRFSATRLGLVVPSEAAGERVPVEVFEVNPGGPADVAGIRVGDVLLAVGSDPVTGPGQFSLMAEGFRTGEAEKLLVRRGGDTLKVEIVPGMTPDWTPRLINAIVALLCLGLALMTVEKRPGSMPSRLLYRLFVFLAIELAMPGPESLAAATLWLSVVCDIIVQVIGGLQFGTELHLISLIPRRPALIRRHPRIIHLFYTAGLFLATLAIAARVVEAFSSRVLAWTYASIYSFQLEEWMVLWASTLVFMLTSRILRYPRSRGRLRAAIVLVGLLPWTLHIYLLYLLNLFGQSISLAVNEYVSLLVLAPYPISIFVMLRLEDAARNRVLRNLIEEVQEAGSIEKISKLISEKLNLAFYTKCNYVFFRQSREGELTSTHSSGSDMVVEHIPSDYVILEVADRKGDTLTYPEDVTEPLPKVEKEWLDNLQASLIVPIVESEGHMMGLLILGQKRSEEPYTPDDLELLHALARQIAVAHENVALQLKVQERERVQRQVLDRLEGREIALVKECPACGFCFDNQEEKCPRDGSELTLTLPVERLIDGHYRLEQVLGRGGAAVVYLATDVRLNRGVALKVLALSLLDDVVAPRRFEREARLSAQLLHPNIVTTHDFGKTWNGLPYIVMEYLEGQTLRKSMKRTGPLSGIVAAEWFDQILDGLGAAHALGVVHRDLKPDNVLIVKGFEEGEEDMVKLLDFGLAKMTAQRRDDDNFTSPGTIMGTLSYMAPEQLSDRGVDPRTDLYSVGVMAYEAVMGKRPFEGRNPPQVLTAILQGEFEFTDEPGAQALRVVLDRCFQQKPERRYGSAAALRKELIPALAAFPRLTAVRTAA